jgi:hypothetical protein
MTRASHETFPATVSGSLARLEEFSERLSGALLACTPCPSLDGKAMLIIESCTPDPDAANDPATWIVTFVAGGRMALEAVVDETRLEMLAIGPADRIVALLKTLAEPVKVDA